MMNVAIGLLLASSSAIAIVTIVCIIKELIEAYKG